LRVTFGRKLLSQDLATSIIECNVLADLTRGVPSPRIAEVGAGYGRVAQTYAASGLPGQYFIFDIPPALGVAQWYLEKTLGPDRVFKFRHFDRFDEIESELASCKVALFTANQICKFPDRYLDVALTISTLPEMRQEQVDLYLSEFQRLSRGHIFIKQWKAWKNPTDGTDLTSDSYKLGPSWRVTLDRPDPVIPLFFNRVWSAHG
jgi:putative sugar O-methyltransferase